MQTALNQPVSRFSPVLDAEAKGEPIGMSTAFLEVVEWLKTAQALKLDSLPQVESSVRTIAAGLIGYGC